MPAKIIYNLTLTLLHLYFHPYFILFSYWLHFLYFPNLNCMKQKLNVISVWNTVTYPWKWRLSFKRFYFPEAQFCLSVFPSFSAWCVNYFHQLFHSYVIKSFSGKTGNLVFSVCPINKSNRFLIAFLCHDLVLWDCLKSFL